MSKGFGKVVVLSTEQYSRKDNSIGYRITAFTDEEQPRVCIFYKDGSSGEPKKGDEYFMSLGIDRKNCPTKQDYLFQAL